MTTTTSDATPDTRLIARVEPPKASYGPAGSGPATRGHRDLRMRHACDMARTERGWRRPRGARAISAGTAHPLGGRHDRTYPALPRPHVEINPLLRMAVHRNRYLWAMSQRNSTVLPSPSSSGTRSASSI
jgi:hypothetical protein